MMNKEDIITYFFENDGDIPNNILPVVIYKNALQHVVQKDLEVLFCQNGWGNNWHDIILTEDHFHSNTHEVLGLKSGQARLKLGGEKEDSSSVLAEIASIPLPDKDPVFGSNGPLFDYWT